MASNYLGKFKYFDKKNVIINKIKMIFWIFIHKEQIKQIEFYDSL